MHLNKLTINNPFCWVRVNNNYSHKLQYLSSTYKLELSNIYLNICIIIITNSGREIIPL